MQLCQPSRGLAKITNATPPRMAADAIKRRGVMDSPSNMMPPAAAITGTLSCTVAAIVAFSPRKAAYQMTYPTPDVNAPDNIAYQKPALSKEAHGSMATLKPAAKGTARRKFPAVT